MVIGANDVEWEETFDGAGDRTPPFDSEGSAGGFIDFAGAIAGYATVNATKAYAEGRIKNKDHFIVEKNSELTLSTIGIGSYLGNADEVTAAAVTMATVASIGEGINVVDTSINYMGQLAERAIGKALKRLVVDEAVIPRDAVFVATKAGFIPRDAEKNLANSDTLKLWIVNHKHCISPACLDMSLKTSLKNLGLSTIDLLYLHNVENQFKYDYLSRDDAFDRITRAFTRLEWFREIGLIRYYGLATWDAFRSDTADDTQLTLHDVLDVALHVGGENHGFRFIQLPLSPNLPEAAINEYMEQRITFLEHASNLGMTVMTSRSIDAASSKYISKTAEIMKECKIADLDTEHNDGSKLSFVVESLNIVRSVPGVTVSLVGMKQQDHVKDNLKLLSHSKLSKSNDKCVMETSSAKLLLDASDKPTTKKLSQRSVKRREKEQEEDHLAHNGEDVTHKKAHKETYAEYLQKALSSTFARNSAFTDGHVDPNAGDDNGDDKYSGKSASAPKKNVRLGDVVRDKRGDTHIRGKASRSPRGTHKRKHFG
eukprot:GSChrysophyteH1.ASY1.ANO1.1771.1 assembled CDS